MFNNNKMTIITRLETLGNYINDINHVSVVALTTETFPRYSNIYNGSILIPPTQILMQWADGDRFVIQNQYPAYLSNNSYVDEFIVALIGSLTRKNIILYIPHDEFDVYGPILISHFYYIYGLQLEILTDKLPYAPFAVIEEKIPFILSKLYLNNLMQANDYLDAYPSNLLLPEFVINKLAMDLQPLDQSATFNDYYNYFNELNVRKMESLGNMVEVIDK